MAVVVVPKGLAKIPPGPTLAIALAGVDARRVANDDLLTVLRAQSRQAAHEQARLLGVIAEVGRAESGCAVSAIDRSAQLREFGCDEVRAALAWSYRAADAECSLADALVHEMPVVYAAFLAGEIDRPKVRAFVSHLSGLLPDQIARICAIIVPIAGRLTPGQIAARLRRLIIAIDPRHYERRYRKALRDRYVVGYLAEDGTAVLTARGLAPAGAAAALERIDTLAQAARNAGHPSTLDQIRVDIVTGLLDGTLHHLDRDRIIRHLIAQRSATDDPPAADPTQAQAQAHAPTDANVTETRDAADAIDPDARRGGDRDNRVGHEPDGRTPNNRGPAGGDRATIDADRACSAGDEPGSNEPRDNEPEPEDQRVGIEIRVALSTLLGLDDHPGEIPGLGPVPAGHARDVVARQHRAEWRFAITDADGRLVFDGSTRRRPPGGDRTGPSAGIVELHIPATLIEDLSTGSTAASTGPTAAGADIGTGDRTFVGQAACGPWAGVLADIARRYADRDKRDLNAHPADRFPHAALRRHIQIRDRNCVGPGCRRRARRCDQDHTVDHRDGGTTTDDDLGPLCRHDHRLKHDAGWLLDQPEPGRFVWISPLGGRYEIRPEPIEPPLPEPIPQPDDPEHDEPAARDDDPFRLYAPPRPPPPAPPPSPPVIDLDEQPPF